MNFNIGDTVYIKGSHVTGCILALIPSGAVIRLAGLFDTACIIQPLSSLRHDYTVLAGCEAHVA